MLRGRRTVTLRSRVAGTDVSTMTVSTTTVCEAGLNSARWSRSSHSAGAVSTPNGNMVR